MEENRNTRKKETEANKTLCKGLSLVPIHRDTQIDSKTEKGGVVKEHSKKRRKNLEKKEANGQNLMKFSVRGYR